MAGHRSASGCIDQAQHQRDQIAGNGVLERDDLDIGRVGHIHRCDDAAQAAQVVGIVGDYQRVVAGVDIDGVVGTDKGAQHWHQVVGRFVVELEYLRDDLAAAGSGRCIAHRDAATLQLCIRLWHYLVKPARLHHGEALQAQRGQKLAVGHSRRHGPLGGQRHHALDARVDHHIAPGDGGHGAGHGLDISVDKIQRDGLTTAGRHQRLNAG